MTEPSGAGGKIVPRLGQLALDKGLITREQLDAAIAEQDVLRKGGKRIRPLGEILVAQGVLTADQLAPLLAEAQSGVPGAAPSTPAKTPTSAALPAQAQSGVPAPAPSTPAKTPSSAALPASAPTKTPSSPKLTAMPAGGPRPAETSGTARKAKMSPTPFGKYTLMREIGRGGKGVVYEAIDTVLDRKVALKMTHQENIADPKDLEIEEQRFLVEARLSAHLPKHPHIVSVYEAGVIDGKRFLAMELISGQAMTRWRKTGGAPLPQQVAVLRDVALAIDQAHRHGVVHRDLKPQNILVDAQGQPHITDFGLAKMAGQKDDTGRAEPGKVWGTPTHMSPEHARGVKTIDGRSDLYSLGVILYEILAGRTPFQGESATELLEKLVREPAPPISKVVGPEGLSPLHQMLEPVCMTALSKSPQDRQANAKAFADEITACLDSLQGKAQGNKKKVIWAAAAAAALLVGALAFVFLGGGAKEEIARGEKLLVEGKYQDALVAFEKALDRDSGNVRAIEGKKNAQNRVKEERESDKRRAADSAATLARRDSEEKARIQSDELKRQMKAARQADEEASIVLKMEQAKLEERARLAEAAAKKAEDQLKQPSPKVIENPLPPTPAPATPPPATAPPATPAPPVPPAPGTPKNAKGAPAVPPAPVGATGEPTVIEGGALHFEAEDFTGGEKPVADIDYHDNSPGNNGRIYRLADVDTWPHQEGGGHYIDNIGAGEWLRYRFKGGGRYEVELKYQARQGGKLRVEIDGTDVSGSISLASTDRRTWTQQKAALGPIPDGTHELRIVFETQNQSFDSFRLIKYTPLAPPDAAKLKDAQKLIQDLFKADYAKRTPADQAALAKKLLEEGRRTQDDAAAKYILYSEAREQGALGGDLVTALAAIRELERCFVLDATALKAETLQGAARAAKTADAHRSVAEAYLALAEEAAGRDDFDPALQHASKAETAARSGQSTGLLAKFQGRVKELTALRDEFLKVKPALKTLEEKPDDPAANLTVGLYRCFAQGDWVRGLPMLAKGSDATLAALAQKEADPPVDPNQQAQLGDAWRDATEKKSTGPLKSRMATRALHWYEKALPGIAGLARLKVDSQIESLYKVIPGADALKKGLVFWIEPGKEPQDPFREFMGGSRVNNSGAVQAPGTVRALSFTQSFLEYPASEAVKSIDRSGSLFAWFKVENIQQVGGIVDRGDQRYDDFGLWIDRGQLGGWFNYPDTRRRHTAQTVVPTGVWVHGGMAWDEKTVTFYLNGKEDGEASLAATEVPFKRSGRVFVGSNAPGGHEYFQGLLGSVMIYSRTLSPQEVMHLYMGTRARFK